MIREFCIWLAEMPWSVALRESQYAYAITESVHVWTLCLFLGMAVLMDLRLIGWGLRDVPITAFIKRLLPWTKAGFAVMVVSGALLWFAIPVRTYHSVWFRGKLIMLVLAGLNAWWFHNRTERSIATWDTSPRLPRQVRMAGVASLVLWAGIVVFGRMIAYNWFDCDRQPQSAIVNWAAGCVLEPTSD
jgi:hypothetical protein